MFSATYHRCQCIDLSCILLNSVGISYILMPLHMELVSLVLSLFNCSLLVRSWWFCRETGRGNRPGRPPSSELVWEGLRREAALGFTHRNLGWQRSWALGQASFRTLEPSWRQEHGNVLKRRSSGWIGRPRNTGGVWKVVQLWGRWGLTHRGSLPDMAALHSGGTRMLYEHGTWSLSSSLIHSFINCVVDPKIKYFLILYIYITYVILYLNKFKKLQ